MQSFGGRNQLIFTSRANCVVKIRGAKVDLGAIEKVFMALFLQMLHEPFLS
jgi:hypothetical protein